MRATIKQIRAAAHIACRDLDEIRQMDDAGIGYCVLCREYTSDCCEADARYYSCPVCENASVFGAQELTILSRWLGLKGVAE